MSYTPRSLFRLLEDIDQHRLLLPHIQRPFVWDREQMAKLFDSLMREYPIQTLLFWRTKEEIRARQFMPVTDPDADLSKLYDMNRSKADVEKTFVLDGQQRLQTLHAIFKGGYRQDSNTAEAYCDLTDGDKEVESGDVLHRLEFSTTPRPLPQFRIRDLTERFAGSNAMVIADDLNDQLAARLVETDDERKRRERRVRANLQQLESILNHDRHFWVDELDGVAKPFPYRRILEIFVRVNSGGTKLTAGDLMFAAMKEGWDDVEERVEQTVDLLNGGRLTIDQDFVLKCLLLAHGEGAEVQTEKFWGPRGESLLKTIEENRDRAERAFQQLRDFVVHSVRVGSDRLIRSYNALVPLFDFYFHNGTPDVTSVPRMVGYYQKAQLFGWYSRQTDAVLNALHSLVGKNRSGDFPLIEIKDYFAKRDMATEFRETYLQDSRLRPIILNIVYCDRWGSSPFDVAFKGNEPHIDHIYPQYMLRSKLDYGSAEINDIGNLRFVGATDNIRKRAELPASYFQRLKQNNVPIEKHLLLTYYAADPGQLEFTREGFDRFRTARREEVLRSVKRTVDPEITS